VLGASVLEILPVVQTAGHVPLALCALSYAGRMHLVVTADAIAFPDLDTLIAGMERGWRLLSGTDPAIGLVAR